MAEAVLEATVYEAIRPDISHIEIEDGAPVDNIFSERQMRLLVESLNASWEGPPPDEDDAARPFMALANVGLFATPHQPALVPDVMVSLDVSALPDPLANKEHNTYFVWIFGKTPDVVIEIVSNRVGGEDGRKLREYARIGVTYYVIYDPAHYLGREALRMYELRHRAYTAMDEQWMPALGLGLRVWRGKYEGMDEEWLRWCDIDGTLLPTGTELATEQKTRAELASKRAEQAEEQAELAKEQAELAKEQAELAVSRAERLAAQLRALGIDPEA